MDVNGVKTGATNVEVYQEGHSCSTSTLNTNDYIPWCWLSRIWIHRSLISSSVPVLAIDFASASAGLIAGRLGSAPCRYSLCLRMPKTRRNTAYAPRWLSHPFENNITSKWNSKSMMFESTTWFPILLNSFGSLWTFPHGATSFWDTPAAVAAAKANLATTCWKRGRGGITSASIQLTHIYILDNWYIQ